jgi:hypothetical protein
LRRCCSTLKQLLWWKKKSGLDTAYGYLNKYCCARRKFGAFTVSPTL